MSYCILVQYSFDRQMWSSFLPRKHQCSVAKSDYSPTSILLHAHLKKPIIFCCDALIPNQDNSENNTFLLSLLNNNIGWSLRFSLSFLLKNCFFSFITTTTTTTRKCMFIFLTSSEITLSVSGYCRQPATRQDLLVYIALRVMTTYQNVQVPWTDAGSNYDHQNRQFNKEFLSVQMFIAFNMLRKIICLASFVSFNWSILKYFKNKCKTVVLIEKNLIKHVVKCNFLIIAADVLPSPRLLQNTFVMLWPIQGYFSPSL